MTAIIDSWHERARDLQPRIVLADSDDRAHAAAAELRDRGLADVVVITDAESHLSEETRAIAAELGTKVDLSDPLYVAALMVRAGEASAVLGGGTRPTADLIRAGLRVLGVAPGIAAVSSCFMMLLRDGHTIAYADCAVLVDPDPDQLADIAVMTASTYQQLTGDQPRVAMLSFSTLGSATHERVDKVRVATERVRSIAPDLAVDGELQFDAAWVPHIAAAKASTSAVAGKANVFVFPDLDSANIAYKITERLGGAVALGPLLQGLNGVMHDLSRGCSVTDIVNIAAIAGIQAASPLTKGDSR